MISLEEALRAADQIHGGIATHGQCVCWYNGGCVPSCSTCRFAGDCLRGRPIDKVMPKMTARINTAIAPAVPMRLLSPAPPIPPTRPPASLNDPMPSLSGLA